MMEAIRMHASASAPNWLYSSTERGVRCEGQILYYTRNVIPHVQKILQLGNLFLAELTYNIIFYSYSSCK